MSNNKNSNEKPTLFFFFLGCFAVLCGALVIKEGKKIEGWGTIILGVLSISYALKD